LALLGTANGDKNGPVCRKEKVTPCWAYGKHKKKQVRALIRQRRTIRAPQDALQSPAPCLKEWVRDIFNGCEDKGSSMYTLVSSSDNAALHGYPIF
jgi:hypothetical protein